MMDTSGEFEDSVEKMMKTILADSAIKGALVSISPTSRQNSEIPHCGNPCWCPWQS
jgi:hypothetical protein